MAYLNPNTIVLDDFSTPEYVQADFLIENAGNMNFLEIEIDRTTDTVTKSTIDDIEWSDNASLLLSNDLNLPNYIPLNPNYQNTMLHTSFLTETSPQNLLRGIVFCICVKNIFKLDDSEMSNLDFVQDNVRLNEVFFGNDPTISFINDVQNSSGNDFNKTVTSDGTNNDEYGYWNTLIGPSNDSLIFVDDDKMYSFYGMRLKLIQGTTPPVSGTSVSDPGNLISNLDFYNQDGIVLYFVIGWNVQMTGFGEGNASSGPKQNWNVEFLDLNNGNSLYDGIVKTDSNGSFYIPQHAINAEVFEISVTCIDSSGFDTLTGEQSEIGENFTAIGTSETGLIAQATPLSSVLVEGFKESANLNLTSYKNLKSSYESAFGISDIDINPYDTEVDDTNATINSSKILEIEALTDGMRTVLSENSSMSRANIQKKIRKAISQKLIAPNIDFTNSTIISNIIENAAGDVVTNGANIITLKNKTTGIVSSINHIKSTFHSHSSSNRNTRLFELHKSFRSVKNVFRTSPNFDTDIESTIVNHRNSLNVSKFNVPSRNLWSRRWNARFISNPPLFVNQDATYTYTPIAKGSLQQDIPITLIFKPSWLNWDGKTLSGTPDNSYVGSHSVILKSIEGNRERNQPFAITVNNINDTPTFTNSPTAIIDIAYQPTYSYTPTVNDIDVGDSLTIISVTDLTNSWLTWDGTTLQGSPNYSQIGTYSIHLRVTDNGSPQRSGNIHFTIEVISTNSPPTFTSTPSAIIDEDSEYNYTPTASDIDTNDTLNFSVPTKPSWLNWNGTKLNGIPTNNDIGSHNVTIRVNDGTVHVDQSFIISVNAVNDGPIFTSTPSAIIAEDTLYSYTPTASDEEGDSLTFSLHYKNETGPAWLNWNGTTLSGTPTNDNVGNTNVIIRVSDGDIHVDQSFVISVNNVNDAPVFTTTPNATIYIDEDSLYTYTPTAADVDIGNNVSISLHYKNEIGPAWLNWDGTTLSGTPTNDNVGNTTVTIRASDGAIHVDQSFTITVNNVNDPPVFTSTPLNSVIDNTTYSYTPTAIDVDLNYSLSFSIVTKPNFLTWNGTTLSGVPSNNTGTHNIIIRVTDGIVNVDQTFTLGVNRYIFETRNSLVTAVNAWTTNSTTAAATYGPINNWDVSQVTNMSQLFKDKTTFNDNISGWDVSNVTHMGTMFNSATSFNKPLNDWNVSSVTDMKGIFCNAKLFNQPLNWNVSKVTTMQNMFYIAEVFNNGGNSSINNWNVSQVTAMASMFREAKAFNQPIGNWNVSNVDRMDYMFATNTPFNQDIGNWNVSNVVLFNNMFHMNSQFNQDIGDWNVSSATNITHMFRYTSKFDQDISDWNVPSSRVTVGLDTYASAGTNHSEPLLFNSSSLYYFKINRTPLTNSNIQAAVDSALNNGNSVSEYGGHISSWNVSQVTNMSQLFEEKTTFNEDISSWDVSNVTNMYRMFREAQSFTGCADFGKRADLPANFGDIGGSWIANNTERFPVDFFAYDVQTDSYIVGIIHYTADGRLKMCRINSDGTNVGGAKYYIGGATISNPNPVPISKEDIISKYNAGIVASNGNGYNFNNGSSFDNITYFGDSLLADWNVSKVINMQEMLNCWWSSGVFNGNISGWNMSNVTHMYGMFINQQKFNQSLNNWNISNVIQLSHVFYGASSFNQPLDSWNVSSITHINDMFNGATSFDQFIASWNVSSVINFNNFGQNSGHSDPVFANSSQYYFTIKQETISQSTIQTAVNDWISNSINATAKYGGHISNWDVSQVTNMESLFKDKNTFNSNISNWNTAKVTNMRNMFWGAGPFNQPLNNWNISKVTNIGAMFYGSPFNQPLNNWNTSKVIVADHLFYSATQFNQNISSWNMSKLTIMANMFKSATQFNQNISFWDVSKVTNFGSYGTSANAHSDNLFKTSSLSYFFVKGRPFTNSELVTAVNEWVSNSTNATAKYGNINNWNTSEVTYMKALFREKTTFNSNISNWNTSKVTNMEQLFYKAESFNQNISSWNVSKVTLMTNMFRNSPFNQNISSWDVSSVTGTASMFRYNSSFNQSLNNWNVSNVIQMHFMFWDATQFNQNISSWNMSKVTNMDSMFKSATQFNQNISGWDVSKVTTFSNYGTGANAHSDSLFKTSSTSYFWIKGRPFTNGFSADGTTTTIFDITNVNTVTKDGANISSNIQYTQGWNTFILETLDPSNSDFYTKEYTIDWEDDPVSYNHGGYYLTYNGLNNFSSDFVRYGGPIWWWYAGEESYSGSTQIKWREGTNKWPNTMFGSQEVWDQFRKKHTLKFKFIDNTNWKITYIINGIEHSQTIPTHGGWTFEDKASIEVRYRMSTSTYVGGITSAHKLTLKPLLFELVTAVNEWISLTTSDTFSSFNLNTTNFWEYMNTHFVATGIFALTGTTIRWEGGANGTDHPDIQINLEDGYVLNINNLWFAANYAKGLWNRKDYSTWWIQDLSPGRLYQFQLYSYNSATVQQFNASFDVVGSTTKSYTFFMGTNTSPVVTDIIEADANGKIFINCMDNGVHGASLAWIRIRALALSKYGNINNWNTSEVTNMEELFKDKSSFNDDITSWNTSKVTNMDRMFNAASNFNQNISGWDVSSLISMERMFGNAVDFNQPIGNWNVSSVTNMREMFENATAFNQTLGLNNFGTGDDLPANFGEFGGAHVGTNGSVNYWAYDSSDGNIIVAREDSNVLKMIKISQDGTIASVADPIRHGSGNPLPTITSAADLISEFYDPQQAGSHLLYTFTKGIGFHDITITNGWNVSSVTNIREMFKNATAFNQNISGWNVSEVTDYTEYGAGTNHTNGQTHANFGSMNAEFGKYNNTDFSTSTVHNLNLPNGRTVTLSQWTHTRDYHKGFLRNQNGNATAVVSGNLISGKLYEVSIYQYSLHSWARTNAPITVNGNGPYNVSASSDGSANASPTWTGIVAANSNAEIVITVNRLSGHAVLSGISIISVSTFSNSDVFYFTMNKPAYTLTNEIEIINVSSAQPRTGSHSLSTWLTTNDGITVTQATTAQTWGSTNGIDNPNRVGYFTDSSGTQFKIVQCWDGHTMGGQTYGTLEHMFTPLYGWMPNSSNGYWFAGTYGMAVMLGYGGNDPTWYYGMGEYTNRHDRSRHTYTNQITFPTPIVIRYVNIISTTGGDFWKRPRGWSLYGSMDDRDNTLAPISYHRGGHRTHFNNSTEEGKMTSNTMLYSRHLIKYQDFCNGSNFDKQQLTIMFDIQLNAWDTNFTRVHDLLFSHSGHLGNSYNQIYSAFMVKQTNNRIETYIAGSAGHLSIQWNATASDFKNSSNQWTKTKCVWTIDVKNYLNGTISQCQQFWINQKQCTIVSTPHGAESIQKYQAYMNAGKWGSSNGNAPLYGQYELYLTAFEGHWDGRNNQTNPTPGVDYLEYLRVFIRIVQPSEWNTGGMFPLNSVSTYVPHELIYSNGGDMGSDNNGTNYIFNSTKLYKTLTIRIDHSVSGNTTGAGFAKVGRMRIFGRKLVASNQLATSTQYIYKFIVNVPHNSTIGHHINDVRVDDVTISSQNISVYTSPDRHPTSLSYLYDGTTTTARWNNRQSSGSLFMTITLDYRPSKFSIQYGRPLYAPGWIIQENNSTIITEVVNRGSASTPSPIYYDYVLPPLSSSGTYTGSSSTSQFDVDYDAKVIANTGGIIV